MLSTSKLLSTVLALASVMVASISSGQIVLNNSGSNGQPANLVQTVLMGQGVFSSNVTFNGNPGSVQAGNTGAGYSDIGRFNGANTVLDMNGVYLSTGVGSLHIPGPNDELMMSSGGVAFGGGMPQQPTPDIDLSQLTAWPMWQVSGGSNIHSKAVLEFDFVPMSDMVSFRYVFSSEEYERWACSQYNDVLGIFISGPGIPTNINGPFTNNAMNIAFVPGSLSPVSINTVNSGRLDVSNANGPWTNPFQYCFDADPNWQAN
ncbi:MAG: choice-of-anchor L domain-containing protein, partial [Flavobacteriales bacterium]|nr:choice-of-anchor L domain-containing protein [Flavobacteriales bacterium]